MDTRKKLIVANFKAQQSALEASHWAQEFANLWSKQDDVRVVLCPASPHLAIMQKLILPELGILWGAQDVSTQDKGRHTGEITTHAYEGLEISSVILGHSERRVAGETATVVEQKIAQAKKANFETILCVRDIADLPANYDGPIAYEPPGAIGIGVGHATSPEDIVLFKKQLATQNSLFLYGGSVDENNIVSYINTEVIDGFLVSSACLDPNQFWRVIQVAAKH